MAHSGKTMTFATDLVPQEDNIYSLGLSDQKWKIFGEVQPLSTRTYNAPLYNSSSGANYYQTFATVIPVDYNAIWIAHYRITITADGHSDYTEICDVSISGRSNTYYSYKIYNSIVAYSIYQHMLLNSNSVSVPHELGYRMQGSYGADSVAKVIKVELLEQLNCTVTLLDNLKLYTSATPSGYTWRGFNATSNGLQETGDNDSYGYYILSNGFKGKAGSNKVYRQCLFARTGDGTYESFVMESNTRATTKTANPHGFVPDGKIYWNSSGSDYSAGTLNISPYEQYHAIDYLYSFNFDNQFLPDYCETYVVYTYNEDDGLLYLDTTQWLAAALPTTEDGKIYQRIGSKYYTGTSNYYQGSLLLDNPYYEYRDGEIRSWSATHLSSITGADDLKAIEAISGTTGLLKKTAANTWTLDTNNYVTSSGITSVTIGATSPVQSSTSTAQNGSSASTTISLKDAYGDTKNPYGAKAKNLVLAGPGSGNNAAPTFRALVAADIPDLSWNKITSDKPTTLNGYGITDAIETVTSTDNAVVRFDGTNGQIQNSGVIVDDNNNISVSSILSNLYSGYNLCKLQTSASGTEIVIKTKFKFVSSSTMPSIRIHGYSYGKGAPLDLTIVYYIYSNEFYVPKVISTGGISPDIYLFTYTEDSIKYVAIGIKASLGYLGFTVDANGGALGELSINPESTLCTTGWTIEHNGSNTSNTLIPAVNTDNCKLVPYIALSTTVEKTISANLTSTTNAVAYYTNTTGTFGSKASANGALYATGANGALQWGTLPIAQGGTGKTTANDAANALISGLPTWTANPTDDTYLIRRDTGGTATYGQVKFSTVWNYIKGKADNVYANQTTVNGLLAAADAMIFKGTLDGAATSSNGGAGGLTPAANCGDTYKVATIGYINGEPVEVGDIIICTTDSTIASTSSNYSTVKANWVIVQNNVDGAIFKGTNGFTDTHVIIADGTNGKVKDSGFTIASSVPANAKFTDTTSFTITANATDGYWDLTGTNGTNAVTYALTPYSSKQSGANFYTGTANPDGTTRLNYNGYLYATKLYSNGTEVSVSGHTHDYAGSSSAGGAATSANALNFVHTNELLLGNANSQSGIHINHRRVSGGATSGNTAITDYYFKNGNGAVTGVTIHAAAFDGSATSAGKWTTARNISISDSDGTNTGTAVSVDGSAAVTLKLPATIKADITGDAATVNGLTVQTAVPANAVFTDTNKYHKTGSWNGLTYTATAVNSADELKFTIPNKIQTNWELNATSGNSPALLFTRDGSLTDWKIFVASGKLSFQSATDGSTWTERAYFKDNSGDFVATSFTGNGSALTNLNASNISSGTLALANLTKGDANTALMGKGSSTAPAYVSVSPSISITAGTADNAPKVNLTVLGVSGTTAQELTKATTGVYGATKLSNAIDSSSEVLAATPKAVKAAYDQATSALTTANNLLATADAMVFKGTLGTGGTITAVPTGASGKEYQAGYTYKVITDGTYAGNVCEAGDLLIAIADSTSGQTAVNNAHWTVVQSNLERYIHYYNNHDNNIDSLIATPYLQTAAANGGNWNGTKPSDSHNGMALFNFQTHSGNYYTQLALDTNQNRLWLRSANNATTFGTWSKIATVADIEALDVSNISGFGTTKTLKTLTQTDGKIAATFQDIAFPVTSVAGKTGAVTLAKGDVGLGNVDNTADANKSVNYATSAGSCTGNAANVTGIVAIANGGTGATTASDARDALFPLTSFTKSITLSNAWQNLGITGADLDTNGTYIIQIYLHSTGTGSLSSYNEYYSGIMSWFKTTTNSDDYDEIPLHKAGHASNGKNIYLRTQRVRVNTSPNTLQLQIKASTNTTIAAEIQIKCRLII